MADKDESQLRSDSAQTLAGEIERLTNRYTSENDTTDVEDQRSSTSDTTREETDDERIAREAEERAEQLKEIDETEISHTHQTSALYRRAVSDFDPHETEPQLAEHWVETDDELERFGYF